MHRLHPRLLLGCSAAILVLSQTVRIGSAAAAENAMYNELLNAGVPLANGKTIKLPAPTMADGLDAPAQTEIMKSVIADKRMTLPQFLEKNANAPFVLNITDTPGKAKESIGRQFDLYFVAHGKLDDVANPDFLKQQTDGSGQEGRGKAEYFTDDELKERGLKVINNEGLKERYAHALLPLFNLVEVSGVGHAMQTRTKDSVLVAYKLDPQFEKDAKYPSQWRLIKRNEVGQPVLGPASPYKGSGAYVKVTALQEPADAVFVEYHLAYDEPHGWWQGGGTLRSRLPIQFQSDVRKFRRDLTAFGKRPAAK